MNEPNRQLTRTLGQWTVTVTWTEDGRFSTQVRGAGRESYMTSDEACAFVDEAVDEARRIAQGLADVTL